MLGELKISLVPLLNFSLWICLALQRLRGHTAPAGHWIPAAPFWNNLGLQELPIKLEDVKFLQNRAVKFGKEGTTLLVWRRGNKNLLRLSDNLEVIWIIIFIYYFGGHSLWLSWLGISLQCGRPMFDPWVGKIPWRREWLPTAVFWPGEFYFAFVQIWV